MSIFSSFHSKIVRFFNDRKARTFCGTHRDLVYYPKDSVFTYETITIGDRVFINKRAYLSGEISIGDDVLIGPDVFITSGDHGFTEIGKPINRQGRMKPRKVTICDDAWIGAKACILAGVTIGKGAVIGAGSVVTKDVPPYSVCVGNPCRKVKDRYSEAERIEHEKLLQTKRELCNSDGTTVGK